VIDGGDGGGNHLCGNRNDRISSGDGIDNVFGEGGIDVIDGGNGNEHLNSIDRVVNNDKLDGGTGTDTCTSEPDLEGNCEAREKVADKKLKNYHFHHLLCTQHPLSED
jgi:hypothetical protein